MSDLWIQTGPTGLAAFIASLVECVEALTIVLAVGATRGWRAALVGCAAALSVLAALILIFGRAIAAIPLNLFQLGVGALLLLFGLRWLRKAILRGAALIPLHDETAAFHEATSRLSGPEAVGWDAVAFATTFQITMLEGAEVVFIVLAIGAGDRARLGIASVGALLALVVVTALGVLVRRPLAHVPENALKFIVGILLSVFGTYWFGEGAGFIWPGADWSLIALALGYLVVAVLAVRLCRSNRRPERSYKIGERLR